ncbi:hypothetical protein [Lolliginicoccus suaedae]|uniref:hypothetical protein n=1 Tax=Lolliginicoccus suaedae TaxID=2605429 RepID=UPI0011ECDFA2|nr:hypothetical protein [Lolliginicoccus suaedae]
MGEQQLAPGAGLVRVIGTPGSGVSTLAGEIASWWPGEAPSGGRWLEVREGRITVAGTIEWDGPPPAARGVVVHVLGQRSRPEDNAAPGALPHDHHPRGQECPGEESCSRVIAVRARADLWWPAERGSSEESRVSARHHASSTDRDPTMDVVALSALHGRAPRVLTLADLESLRALASASASGTEAYWLAGDLFARGATAIEAAQRQRLLEVLDLTGIRIAVDALRANEYLALDELGELMQQHSGIGALRERLAHALWRASALRAGDARIDGSDAVATILDVPWSPIAAAVDRARLIELAADARARARAAMTPRSARAALAEYQHMVRLAQGCAQ